MSGSENGAGGVLVLGPGRSGTSSITRSFVLAGFFAGEEGEVLGPDDGNALGHYEPLPVLRLNEELLAKLECSWWAGRPDPAKQLALREQAEPQIRAVLEAMASASGGRPLAVKEPRVNSLLPLWGPAVEGRLHPVLAVRDPVEVALSQARRDGTTPAHALAAWEVQMATLLEWLDGRTVTIAPYGELLSRPQLAVELVTAASAHLDPDHRRAVTAARAEEALDPGQRHEAVADSAHEEYLTPRQLEIWRFLAALPAGDVEMEAPPALRSPSKAALAAIEKENELIDFAAEHGRVAGLLKDAGERLTKLGETSIRLRDELGSSQARVDELERKLAEAEARHAAEVAAIRASLSWRITTPLRRLRAFRHRQ